MFILADGVPARCRVQTLGHCLLFTHTLDGGNRLSMKFEHAWQRAICLWHIAVDLHKKCFLGQSTILDLRGLARADGTFPYFDLGAVASTEDRTAAQRQALAALHIPKRDS